jgi:uroporphyrinogen III methyltransferase/synthase
VIVVLGEVAGLPRQANWFEKLPLFGRAVLVTRPAHQAGELAGRLEELGAEVLLQPAIEIGEPPDWKPADKALAELSEFDWIVFSSVNGVTAFMKRLWEIGRDVRAFSNARVAAIGPATADALEKQHLRVDCVPPQYQAEALAAALQDEAAGNSFLLVRASRGREVLARELVSAGGRVTQAVFYESRDAVAPAPEVVAALKEEKITWTTVTSSAIARSLVNLFPQQLHKTRLATISSVTTATLEQFGYTVTAEADEATMEGVVQAIIDYENQSGRGSS